jgi:protocatechuate 3,4-dioxygenase beta subunit
MKNKHPARLAVGILLVGLLLFAGGIYRLIAGSDDGVFRTARDASDVERAHEAAPEARASAGRDTPAAGILGEGRSAQHERGSGADVPDRAATPRSAEGSALPRGTSSLRFNVQDTSGAPLAGVRVSLGLGRSSSAEIATDESGRALFAELAAASYSYWVQPSEGPRLASASSVVLRPGEEKILTLRLPRGDLTISGRVLDQRGAPVAGIELVGIGYRLEGQLLVSSEPAKRRARSREDGSYEITDLAEGDYIVRTVDTQRYLAAKVVVRAGSDAADIVLTEARGVRIYGTVTDERDDRLSGVYVAPTRQAIKDVYTAEDGTYELILALTADGSSSESVRFGLDGYRSKTHRISLADGKSDAGIRLDARLERLTDTVEVSGRVQARNGGPVAGERIQLTSPKGASSYSGISGGDGHFRIAGIATGSDYGVSVRPKSMYRDYLKVPLALESDGVFLDIQLEPLATGRLNGRLVDVEGSPLPRLSLWLTSAWAMHSRLQVLSDDAGRFEADDVSEGPLTLRTRTAPSLAVSGIHLNAQDALDLDLVLDLGDHVLEGRVVNEQGDPVAGSRVSLSWSHTDGDIRSRSNRSATSDQAGLFRFAQLGPGVHRVDVRASDNRNAKESYDVGRESMELRIQLAPRKEADR